MRTMFAGAACLLAIACAPQTPPPMAQDQIVARGEYLVMNAGCNDCHTPMGPQGPDMTHALQGTPLFFRPAEGVEIPGWVSVAPPIAGLPEGFTEEQMATLMQTGVRPNGTHPSPPMPPFRWNEEDARAIAAYVKSLPRAQ